MESLPKEYIPGLNALNAQAKNFICAKKNIPQEDRADRPLVTCDTKTGEVAVLSPSVIEGTDVKEELPGNAARRVDVDLPAGAVADTIVRTAASRSGGTLSVPARSDAACSTA